MKPISLSFFSARPLSCFLALSALILGPASAATEPLPLSGTVPQTQRAQYPIQTLPTAHALPIEVSVLPQDRGLAWLDNRRALFYGALPEKELDTRGLFIWDVVGNTVSHYSRHIRFCYADGYIVAFGPSPSRTDADRPASVSVRWGEIGKEKDDVCDIATRKGCPPTLRNMSCQPGEYAESPLQEFPSVVLDLRNGDGAILTNDALKRPEEGGPSTREGIRAFFDKPLLLHNKRYPNGKPLPITAIEGISRLGVGYSEYVKQYALLTERPTDGEHGRTTIWPPGRAQPVYLMDANGAIETIQVPSKRAFAKIHFAMPSQAGLIFIGSGGYAEQWGGLFLYDNREVWELDRGRVYTFAVSPNGCRLAYAIINDFGKTRNVRFNSIKSINFCAKEK